MPDHVILLSIPGLRKADIQRMPTLKRLAEQGDATNLVASFPCVTCPVQANMTTGRVPREHGVVANGFYWRDKHQVEMWTAWNDAIERPQIWDMLHQHDESLTSAAWFGLLSKGAGADLICTPAPIHNPDGSESLWCYTQPTELFGRLRDAVGHFPPLNFCGPLANRKSTQWIVEAAVVAARRFQPRFTYVYLPHLDYAAQKFGPDSPQAATATVELDATIGRLQDGLTEAGLDDVLWVCASEYVITPVRSAGFPNRRLREAGLLTLVEHEGTDLLDVRASRAWALVDHQLAHVFVKDAGDVERVAAVFRDDPSVHEVLTGSDRARRNLDHPRAGEVVLIAKPDQWFAYYWWLDDARAPAFARTVDIHRKPGYDPVELFIEMPARTIPLTPSLVKGSHGFPADDATRRGVLISSTSTGVRPQADGAVADTAVSNIILQNFGVTRG